MLLGKRSLLSYAKNGFPRFEAASKKGAVPPQLMMKMDELVFSHKKGVSVGVMDYEWEQDSTVLIPHHGYTLMEPAARPIKIGHPDITHGQNENERWTSLVYHELTHACDPAGTEVDAEAVERVMGSSHLNTMSLKSGLRADGKIHGTYYTLEVGPEWITHNGLNFWPSSVLLAGQFPRVAPPSSLSPLNYPTASRDHHERSHTQLAGAYLWSAEDYTRWKQANNLP
jgi:hypothetical protein